MCERFPECQVHRMREKDKEEFEKERNYTNMSLSSCTRGET